MGHKAGVRGLLFQPTPVFALWGGNDLDIHVGGCDRRDLLAHAVGDARKHGCAAGQQNVVVENLAYVDDALHDRADHHVMDAGKILAEH